MVSVAVPNLVTDSRGRHALLALLDSKNQKQLEELTEVSQPALSLIAKRRRKPGRDLATRLQHKAGIEFEWWDAPPTKAQLAADRLRHAKGAA